MQLYENAKAHSPVLIRKYRNVGALNMQSVKKMIY